MLKYEKIPKQSLFAFTLMALVLVIAYLPVSSFLFALKNDSFTGYFPPKFFMSESISSGHLPLWNPYINYGFPQYGDMSSGYWNPITWIIATTIGYNAYSFTVETLLYIFLSGVGMYTLCKYYRFCSTVCLVAAFSYMCSGYMVGHLQHFNWLSGAAFFPFCVATYLKCVEKFSLKTTLLAAIAFYFFISASHPGLTIAAFYFLLSLAVFTFLKEKKWSQKSILIEQLKVHGLLIIALLLLSVGLIMGYLDIIPNFVRGEKIGLASTLLDPTSAQSWLGILFPFATTKNEAFFNTDISMRNTYFGLTMLVFFMSAVIQKKSSIQKFFLFTGIFFMLLSAGGIFKTIAYYSIPYIGYVRLNGEFLIFSIFCFLLFSAFSLQQFFLENQTISKALKRVFSFVKLLCVFTFVLAVIMILSKQNSLFYQLENLTATLGITNRLKFIIDKLSFYDTLIIQSVIQFIFCILIEKALISKRWKLFILVAAADLIIASLLNVPFTGTGQLSVKEVNNIINQAPKGITIPSLTPIVALKQHTEYTKIIGAWSIYSKDLGTVEHVAYPIALKNEAAYFSSLENGDSSWLQHPFAFLASSNGSVKILKFTGNSFLFSLQTISDDTLFVQQNYYTHWKYNNSYTVTKAGEAFMAIPVEAGHSTINVSFDNKDLIWAMLISLISFLLYLVIIIISSIRSSLSLPRKLHRP